MKKPKTIYNKGFTLIELMVVIGIISLLSAVILASLTQAKAQATNTKQIADYRVVLSALLQFKQDNGYYPSSGLTGTYTCIGNYSEGGCKKTDNVISNNPAMNSSLQKYLSSYSFVDQTVKIADTVGIIKDYKGFIFACTGGNPQCSNGKLLFPALKNSNSCPQMMSDISTSDFYLGAISDYTWCSVLLN